MPTKTPSRIRRRLVTAALGAALLLMPFGGGAQATSAMTCEPEIQDVCTAAGTVICQVVAKGRPCLM
ncbi:MAG: hypothetical protein KY395_03515 [Actinobacteria bacterium]|nr:hypothetical protein [Actinomycetota bacterium]